MSRSSHCRGQVEPLAALVAVAVVAAALSLYAGAMPAAAPTTDRNPTVPTTARVVDALANGSVVEPPLGGLRSLAPDGYRLRVVLRTASAVWRVGPEAPAGSRPARRTVPVRTGPGRVVPGRLMVVVWR